MFDSLEVLDPVSRRTTRAFVDRSLQLSAKGMHDLLTEDCLFDGALSAGPLRGRMVVEVHLRQVFKSVAAKGVARPCGLTVQGREVTFAWEIVDPSGAVPGGAPGKIFLVLDDSGLIAEIGTEWDPRQVLRLTSPR